MAQCTAFRPDGGQCQRHTGRGSLYCWAHDPDKADERAVQVEKIRRTLRRHRGLPAGYVESYPVREEPAEPVALWCDDSYDFTDSLGEEDGKVFLPPILSRSGRFLPSPRLLERRPCGEDNQPRHVWQCPFCESGRVVGSRASGYCDCGAVVALDYYYFEADATMIQIAICSGMAKTIVRGDEPGLEVAVENNELGIPITKWRIAKPRRVRARVGRWEYEGEIRDDTFHYSGSGGNPLSATRFHILEELS